MGSPQKKHLVIASQTQQRSKDHLMNIRKEIEDNKLMAENLGPYQETEDRWQRKKQTNFGLFFCKNALSAGHIATP